MSRLEDTVDSSFPVVDWIKSEVPLTWSMRLTGSVDQDLPTPGASGGVCLLCSPIVMISICVPISGCPHVGGDIPWDVFLIEL